MEIEIELALFINLFLNSFILKLTGIFLKDRARLWLLSALLAGVIAIILPMFSLAWQLKLLVIVFTCNIMVAISFQVKNIKQFLTKFTVVLLCTFLFGGGCYAVGSVFGSYPLFLVCLIGSIVYIASKSILLLQQRKDKIAKFTFNVMLKDGDKVVYEEGYLDSGNVLYDNITKKPIILVTFEVFNKLYQNINYINALTKNFDRSLVKDGHYIKINSIGSGTNILVFTVDEVVLNSEKCFKDVAVGLSFSQFDKSFGKKILLNNALV